MREIPLEENSAAFAFAEKLFAGGFDMVILLTGVGHAPVESPAGRAAFPRRRSPRL